MSRDRQLRSARVLHFGLASLAQLTTAVAKKLKDYILTKRSTRVGGPLSVDCVLIQKTINACFNVQTWPLPAYGSCLGMWAA